MNDHNFYNYIQYLERRIRQLEDKLLILETTLNGVKGNVEQLKPIHIDNVNYKVQELTVQDLSGTLNIGLTALSDADQMEQWLEKTKKDKEDESQTHFSNLFSNKEEL